MIAESSKIAAPLAALNYKELNGASMAVSKAQRIRFYVGPPEVALWWTARHSGSRDITWSTCFRSNPDWDGEGRATLNGGPSVVQWTGSMNYNCNRWRFSTSDHNFSQQFNNIDDDDDDDDNNNNNVPDFGSGRFGIRPFLANPAKSRSNKIFAGFPDLADFSTAKSNETSLGLWRFEWLDVWHTLTIIADCHGTELT